VLLLLLLPCAALGCWHIQAKGLLPPAACPAATGCRSTAAAAVACIVLCCCWTSPGAAPEALCEGAAGAAAAAVLNGTALHCVKLAINDVQQHPAGQGELGRFRSKLLEACGRGELLLLQHHAGNGVAARMHMCCGHIDEVRMRAGSRLEAGVLPCYSDVFCEMRGIEVPKPRPQAHPDLHHLH
jgi:hypothetical protein